LTETFVAARIGAPFGLDGRVKVESLSGEAEHILSLKTIRIQKDTQRRTSGTPDTAGMRDAPAEGSAQPPLAEYAVEAAYESPLSLKLRGIDSPEAARALKGALIVVPRSQAAPLKPGEVYIEDLKGLEVVAEERLLGRITDIVEGGGGLLAEVELAGGLPGHYQWTGEKRLVPFRDEFFGPVQPETGRVELKNTWILE